MGTRVFDIDGAGLRDHSWGPRSWSGIGCSTWVHAQFPDTGRAFMSVVVSGRGSPSADPFRHTVVSDRSSVTEVGVRGLTQATDLAQAEKGDEFTLVMPDGGLSTVRTELISPMRMHLLGQSEFALGTGARGGPHPVSHDYVPSFARIEWDGEIGYGYHERIVLR